MSERTEHITDVKVGESISMDGGRIVLTVEAKSGQLARLRLSTIPGVAIDRIHPVKSGADLAKGGIHWGR